MTPQKETSKEEAVHDSSALPSERFCVQKGELVRLTEEMIKAAPYKKYEEFVDDEEDDFT